MRSGISVCLLAILALGCAELTGEQLARARAQREFDCPPPEIKVRLLGEAPRDFYIYKVMACGRVVNYACRESDQSCFKE